MVSSEGKGRRWTCGVSLPAAGHIKITEKGKVVADREFPQKIDDTYALWRNDPRFRMWMTDPRFRYTIPPHDRKRFGQ